jgi:hypothetical protein
MNTEKLFRQELVNYLKKPHTHMSLSDAVKDFPTKLINENPPGVPYSFWELLEHIRISQWDMIDFIQNANYKEMEWPKDYWPSKETKATKEMWDGSLEKFNNDLEILEKIIDNPENELLVPIKHGKGQTIFREILQIIDHNSYHIGELIIMRRNLNTWGK